MLLKTTNHLSDTNWRCRLYQMTPRKSDKQIQALFYRDEIYV